MWSVCAPVCVYACVRETWVRVCVCVCSDAIFKPILIKFHLIFLVLSRFHWGHVELKCRFSRLCFISTLAITFHISHLSFLCHYFPAGSKRLEEEVKDGRLYITAEQAGCGESVAEITKLLAALSHVVILLSSVFMAFASFLPSTAASKPVLTRLPAIHLCGRFDQLSYLWNSHSSHSLEDGDVCSIVRCPGLSHLSRSLTPHWPKTCWAARKG